MGAKGFFLVGVVVGERLWEPVYELRQKMLPESKTCTLKCLSDSHEERLQNQTPTIYSDGLWIWTWDYALSGNTLGVGF